MNDKKINILKVIPVNEKINVILATVRTMVATNLAIGWQESGQIYISSHIMSSKDLVQLFIGAHIFAEYLKKTTKQGPIDFAIAASETVASRYTGEKLLPYEKERFGQLAPLSVKDILKIVQDLNCRPTLSRLEIIIEHTMNDEFGRPVLDIKALEEYIKQNRIDSNIINQFIVDYREKQEENSKY